MKKIIIINSPLFRELNENYDEDSLPPLGLGYIATMLKLSEIEVELIDAVDQRIPLISLFQNLNTQQPQFIATNIFTTNAHLVKEIIEGIEFETHFIIGGLSTKQLYNEILKWKTKNPIDVVTGDGELIAVDIVKNKIKETPFFQEGNRRVFKVVKGSIYEVANISAIPLDRSFLKNEPINHPLGFIEANIIASRGCVYNCTFCAAARSVNSDYSVRERTTESLANELQEIKQQYPEVNSIRVLDDLFLKNSKSVQKAIQVFSQFDLQWRSMAHVMTFQKVIPETMIALKDSGCHELFIGIEAGSPTILQSINNNSSVKIKRQFCQISVFV